MTEEANTETNPRPSEPRSRDCVPDLGFLLKYVSERTENSRQSSPCGGARTSVMRSQRAMRGRIDA
jgi:hypothetical protein